MPTASQGLEDTDGLIFAWERQALSRWRLIPMIVFSVVVHAVTFYLLQVAYTPTGSQLPPPAQVVLIPLDQPENASLARWLAVNDPALLTHPTPLTSGQLLGSIPFHYVPSFDAGPPPFKPVETAETAENAALAAPIPKPRPPGPVPLILPMESGGSSTQRAARSQAPVAGRATSVVFTGGIEMPAAASMPPVVFSVAQGVKPLAPTAFLVGAPADGGAPFLFRNTSSGDAAADEFAREYLLGLPVRPIGRLASGSVAWGWATFYWGASVYR